MMTKQSKNYLKKIPKESKKPVLQQFECKFCGTKFHKETTLGTHMCVKKRRSMEIDTPASRFGFRAYQRFYELSASSKKPKTVQEFIESPYYIEFVKFGHHLVALRPVYPEKFIEFVIRNSIKLKDWTKDYVYDVYIKDLIRKEPPEAAVERSITEIMEWTTTNNTSFNTFFTQISANEAAHLIRTGKISPWVLYLCETGGNLMERFNEDHAKIIGDIIEPGFWKKRFKDNDDVEYISSVLDASGL